MSTHRVLVSLSQTSNMVFLANDFFCLLDLCHKEGNL